MYVVSPKDQDRVHLKLILTIKKGSTNWEELKIFEGLKYDDYRSQAIVMGLFKDDSQIFQIFGEAVEIMKPS